jgi:ectoine hydroxylase-related dioxygenase (phytanoyl-CoA dioxygenase family)
MSFKRPQHLKDDNIAHIKFGEDPVSKLKKYGYCVVENVLSNKICNDTIKSMWKWLEGLGTGIKRNDKTTWSNKNWIMSLHQGMIQHTLGHEEFMWKIREHKNVIKIFSQIHKTNKLLVSFDGATIARPPETGFVRSSDNCWLHTDQNIITDINKEWSIQGVANFEDSGDEDGCLFIGEGSHLLHTKLFQNNKKNPKGNWYKLNENDVNYIIKNKIKFKKVNAPKGSLILFDSRCIHSGYPNQKNREIERLRYVIYLAMTPSIRATKKDIAKKIKAVKEGRTTSHWSSNNIKLFGKPRTYGGDFPNYLTRKENIPDYDKWSIRRKKLSGLIPY